MFLDEALGWVSMSVWGEGGQLGVKTAYMHLYDMQEIYMLRIRPHAAHTQNAPAVAASVWACAAKDKDSVHWCFVTAALGAQSTQPLLSLLLLAAVGWVRGERCEI